MTLEFNSVSSLRSLLVCSLMSNKQIIIKEIRSFDTNPGLKPYEVCLLKLIDKVTNGSMVNINHTGTKLIFRPGIITNNDGVPFEYQCDLERSISYYMEPLIMIGLMGKAKLQGTLYGNTNDNTD